MVPGTEESFGLNGILVLQNEKFRTLSTAYG